jgi:hypothetical protein
MESNDNGGLIGIALGRCDLVIPDQALLTLDKVMGRGLLKVISAKRALKGRLIVAVASGADGH